MKIIYFGEIIDGNHGLGSILDEPVRLKLNWFGDMEKEV
jgi:hypothetical protein